MDSLLTIGVSNAAAVAVLSLVLIPLAQWLRRPALTHAVCVLLLLKLVTPPLFTLPLHWLPSAGTASAPVFIERPTAETAADARETATAATDQEWIAAEDAAIDEPMSVLPAAPAFVAPQPAPPVQSRPPAPFPWARACAIAWLAAALLCSAMIAVRLLALRRFLGSAVMAPGDVQAHARALSARLGIRGAPPPVLFVPGRPCPMLLAVFTAPRLLVPRALWERLDPDQRQTLLLHELAHLRRRDHWVRCLELLVTVLYWWHPAAWWARVTLREAEEQCCDAWVVWAMPGAVRTYMATLLDAVDFLCEPDASAAAAAAAGRPPLPVIPATPMLASGMGQFHCLERRLTMVKYQAVQRSLSRRGFAAVIGVAALLPLAPTLAQQSTPPPSPSDSVAPVHVVPEPAITPVKAIDGEESARDAKADTSPVPASAAEPANASNGSRDDEIVRLRRELESMRAQLRAYEAQLRSSREEIDVRDARETRTTRTAPVPPTPANRQPDGVEHRTVTVPATPQATNARTNALPDGEVRVVTRNGVTYRELLTKAATGNPSGEIVVRSGDGQVQGLDRETGKILWSFRTADAKVNGVSVERGVAHVQLSDGKTLQLDVPTGQAVGNTAHVVRSRDGGGDQEQRLRSLEEKLDRLMKEVDRRNQNPNENQDHNRESRPGTTPGPARS